MNNPANEGEIPAKKKRGPYKVYANHGSRAKIPSSTKRLWKSKLRKENRYANRKSGTKKTVMEINQRNQMNTAELVNLTNKHDLRYTGKELAPIHVTTCETLNTEDNIDTVENLIEEMQSCATAHSYSNVVESNEIFDDHELAATGSSTNIIHHEEGCSDYRDINANRDLVETLLVLATKSRHNLTYAATQDIARLPGIMASSSAKKHSKYYWKKMMDKLLTCMTVHHLCPECASYVGIPSSEILVCESCNTAINVKKNVREHKVFIYISVAQQLREIFELTDAHNSCEQQRQKLCEHGIEDITDGKLYKEKMNANMISLNISIDGAPVFDSSNSSIYPILCMVNELEVKQRRSNMLLCSLWFGQGKPDMAEYLKPFVAESKTLYNEGFSYTYKGSSFTKKCLVLMCISDSVARPTLRNSYQFNGEYGCGLCLHRGETIAKGRGAVRVYPLDKDGIPFGEGLRTHEQTNQHARSKEKGIKGPSILCEVPHFDIIKSLDADWMHCVPLGVCRQLAKLWFDSSNHDKPFYFGRLENHVNSYLLSIRPNFEISRTPREMSDRSHWKAHEWVVFLLFYSLPILRQLIPAPYVKHWALLVDGVSTLLQETIMPSEIEFARSFFIEFINGVEELYGKECLSFNVHLLSHLPDSVLNWGPLWSHSAFPYENANQDLLSFVRSSNGVALQICNQFQMKCVVNRLYNLCYELMTEDQKDYVIDMLNKDKRHKPSLILRGATMLGSVTILEKLPRDQYLALQRSNINIDDQSIIQCYQRAIISNELFHSKQYSRVHKRASYYVLLQNQEIFEIELFMVVRINGNLTPLAIGKYFEKKKSPFMKNRRLKHLIPLSRREANFSVISTQLMREKVNLIEMPSLIVACVFPSHHELLT